MGASVTVKAIKRILMIVCVFAVTLAFSIPAFAIGFDAEAVYESVFVVYSGNSLGSGFAIGSNCVITNAHVISASDLTRIQTYTGQFYDTFLLAKDDRLDIAVLGIKDVSFTPLKVADLSQLSVGDDVCAIGAPNSMAYTLTKGVISAKERQVGRYKYLQTDAAINTGNSGGPLLNDSGEVVGVNSYKMSDSEGIGLAIPIDVVTSFLTQNDFSLDSVGNIDGFVIEKSEKDESSPINEDNEAASIEERDATVIVLSISLAISLVMNIIMIILLAYQKRKNKYPTVDPSERTDFDIDILN